MQRRRFNAAFKREALRLATQSGTSRAQVAQELGLNATMLGRWIREAREGKWEIAPGKPLKTERDIPKKRRWRGRAASKRSVGGCTADRADPQELPGERQDLQQSARVASFVRLR